MSDIPDYTQTLNDLFTLHEPNDQEMAAIVQGLREQRERWNIEQRKGSRKLVKSSGIAAQTPKLGLTKAIKGLKL